MSRTCRRSIFLFCFFFLLVAAAVALVVHFVVRKHTSHRPDVPLGANNRVLGVNYGTSYTSDPFDHTETVSALQRWGIGRVKLFSADANVLKAFQNSHIEVVVGVQDSEVPSISGSKDGAAAWVQENVKAQRDAGVNVTMITVSNEPLSSGTRTNVDTNTLQAAIGNLQDALRATGLDALVSVTVPFSMTVVDGLTAFPPSSGRFTDGLGIDKILAQLNSSGSPFMINIYPYLSLVHGGTYGLGYESYALLRKGAPGLRDDATGHLYTSLFDAMYDTVLSALANAGYPRMELVVGEVGWPTGGYPFGNERMAGEFTSNIISHALSGAGSPLRPNRFIQIFLFQFLSEDLKSLELGNYEPHWGTFAPSSEPCPGQQLVNATCPSNTLPASHAPPKNGGHTYYSPIFPFAFPGSGSPAPADTDIAWYADKGIEQSPMFGSGGGTDLGQSGLNASNENLAQRWCIAKRPLPEDEAKTREKIDFACNNGGDCSGLSNCGKAPELWWNASYAFNSFFQKKGGDPSACALLELAEQIDVDPSFDQCIYETQRHVPLGALSAAARRDSLSQTAMWTNVLALWLAVVAAFLW